MALTTIAITVIAFLVALMIVYFQYFFRTKKNADLKILALLRFLTVFSILILLINPIINQKIIDIEKPKLLLAVDNSASISFTKQDSILKSIVNRLKIDKRIIEKFAIESFSFGNSLQATSNFSFKENQTNINRALNDLNTISNEGIAPIILISDGNQTFGRDYKYYQSKQDIYPIILGDTATISDLEIGQINVNSYSFLNNNFPVEVFIRYKGNNNFNTYYIVELEGKVIFKKKIKFSKANNSIHLKFNLLASNIGKHLYKTRVETFNNEKNVLNNFKTFSIEIINEQSNIAIIYDVLHPDIGMLKRSIESNKQRKVSLISIDNINNDTIDNDAIIIYQPNSKFTNLFNRIKKSNTNYFIITGLHTDWNFLNNIQSRFVNKDSSSKEIFFAKFNNNFSLFHIEDINFRDFPPLEGLFGEITFLTQHNSLLTQYINGIDTNTPLLTVFTSGKNRGVVLFGENIWKWRSSSYSTEQSFQSFDQFMNSIIQYLTITKKSNPIELDYDSFYYSDQQVKITAKIYDANFNFDNSNNLELVLNGSSKHIPFYLNKNLYEVKLNDLKSGDYNFHVINAQNDKRVNGSFSVVDYSLEQIKNKANTTDLQFLANNNNGQTFYPDQLEDLIDLLLTNKNYTIIQKEHIKSLSIINWKWVFALIIVSLSLEWFIRKYRGLI